MNQEISSFNSKMTNIFIGLFSKNPLLRPYSLKIHNLGYKIHSIEPSFKSKGKIINPEAIAYSDNRNHALLTEWTAANSLSDEKEKQIRRYLLVDSDDLRKIGSANVDFNANGSCSLWVTVLPDSLQTFQNIFDNTNSGRLVLCSFYQLPTGEHCIEFHSGNISDTELSSIISTNMKFKRIPEGYLPIPIEDLKDPRVSDSVIQQVITFLIRENYEFSVEDICESMIEIWNYLPTEKRKGIIKAVKRIMRNLASRQYCRDWLVYERPNWKARNLSKTNLNKFISKVSADNINFNQPNADSNLEN